MYDVERSVPGMTSTASSPPQHKATGEESERTGQRNDRRSGVRSEDPGVFGTVAQDATAETDHRGLPIDGRRFPGPVVPVIDVRRLRTVAVFVGIFDTDADEEVTKTVVDEVVFEGELRAAPKEFDGILTGERSVVDERNVEDVGVTVGEVELNAGECVAGTDGPSIHEVGVGGRREQYGANEQRGDRVTNA